MILKDDEYKAVNKKPKRSYFTVAVVAVAVVVLVVSLFQIGSYLWEGKAQKDFNQIMIDEGITPVTPKTEDGEKTTVGTENPTSEKIPTPTTSSSDAEKPVPILKTPDISVDFGKLSSKYPGIVGWLYMQGGEIHDPVMQAKNNDYYLYRLPNGKKNASGSLFMDFRDNSSLSGWNHLIYGHNMKNGEMFGSLHEYRKAGYYESHPYLFYFTPSGTYRVEIFAGIHTLSESFVYTRPAGQQGRQNYLNEALSRSVFTSNVSVTPNDSILVLSTCSGAADGDERFIILGKLVPLS